MTVDVAVVARRTVLVAIAATAVTAVFAGLARVGVSVAWGPAHAQAHGPLFALGVIGAVVALERAAAVRFAWALVAPALGAAAATAMVAGLSGAPWIATAAALALVGLDAFIVRKQGAAFTVLTLLGSLELLLGNVMWALGSPVFRVVPAWIGFVVLTIVAERVDMSRLAPAPRWAVALLVALALLFALGTSTSVLGMQAALRAAGVVVGLVAVWQARFDLARKTVRMHGLPRFAALGVLLGLGWLFLAAAILASTPLPTVGALYDAALHSVFVGYGLSMIFAHAPIVLPSVARIELPFSGWLYVPLAVLHVGLVARIAGDLGGNATLRAAGATANAIALGLYAVAASYARARSPHRR